MLSRRGLLFAVSCLQILMEKNSKFYRPNYSIRFFQDSTRSIQYPIESTEAIVRRVRIFYVV